MAGDFRGGEGVGAFEMADGAGDFDEMQRVDDAGAAAGGDAEDGLRVLEVGVHARCGVMNQARRCSAACSAYRLSLVRSHAAVSAGTMQTEADEREAMVVEVVGIGEAVATDVGAAGILGVGPPVVALRRSSRAGRRCCGRSDAAVMVMGCWVR